MMKGWRAIVLTAVLAAIASAAGTWIGASWVLDRRERPSLHDIVHDELDLTAAQHAEIGVIERGSPPSVPGWRERSAPPLRNWLRPSSRVRATAPGFRPPSIISTPPWAPCRKRPSHMCSRCDRS